MPSSIDYLLIGHIAADIIPGGRLLGGTVSYAAKTAHAFGLKVGVLTSARPDEPLLEELRPYAEVVTIASPETTMFENIYSKEGRIQYVRGVGGRIAKADVPETWLKTPLVHVAPLTDEIDADVALMFGQAKTRMLTPQGWMRRWEANGRVHFKPWFEEDVIRAMDIVVFSEEDIQEAPQLEGLFMKVADKLVVTRGYHGGRYYMEGTAYTYAAVETDSVDPTGAGDIFAASLLAAYHEFQDFLVAIRAAATIAAYSITRIGLEGSPTPEEVDSIREIG